MMYIDAYASNGANFLGKLRDIILTGLCALFVIKDEFSMGTMMMISFPRTIDTVCLTVVFLGK